MTFKLISETLRYYPPTPLGDRTCIKDYRLPGYDLTVKKGESIVIPVYGMHHDPRFFPEPEQFRPERFSPENKGNITPQAYLPFGQGPRSCIGKR